MAELDGKKVLVVEDNRANRELVCLLLQQAGYSVLAAPEAVEGIALARAENPALILMDISLPGMDGLEAARILKADPTTDQTPIVAMTAHAMKDDRQKMLDAGFVAYIAKPIRINDFRRVVQECVGS